MLVNKAISLRGCSTGDICMWKYRRAGLFAALLWTAFAPICAAQQLVVGSGASFSLGSSTVDAGCNDLQVAGTLDLGVGTLENVRDVAAGGTLLGGNGTLSLSGDLSLGSSLQAQSGTVRVADGCGRSESRVNGNHQFNRLTVQTDSGRALVLPAGGTQMIASALELAGGLQRLLLRSTVPGMVSALALASGGTQSILRVDARDVGAPSTAQYLAPGLPALYDSIDQGNTPRFFAGGPEDAIIPVPSLSPSGLLLLLLSMTAIAAIKLRTMTRGEP
jgi:hypothetical protein